MLRGLALLIMCLAAAPLRAETVNVEIDGAAIALEIPVGHCQLDRSRPQERAVIETVERLVATTNRVLAAFAECGQLTEYREGRRRLLDDFGQYMTPLRGGRVNMDPAAFAQRMTEESKAQGAQMLQGAESMIRERLDGMRTGIRMGENRLIGVLRTDQRASYLGIVQNLGLPDGTSKFQLGIITFGLLKQRVVTLNLYTRLDQGTPGDATVNTLLGVAVLTFENTAKINAQ